jgi:two-component system, chemotaxis family, protein-glutamate methylesterase/glutaminase
MPAPQIIVIGASAGGVEALTTLARGLPADFPAPLFAVLHVPSHGSSVLPQLLTRAGPLPAHHPQHGEPILRGRWYVAPPDHHLLIREDHVHLGRGPSENGHRPAIDPLFRSAASAFEARVIGVVLTGSLDDGTAGLMAIKRAGGVAIVQDPAEALYSSMPQSALEHVNVDHVCSIEKLAQLLTRLVREPVATAESTMPSDEKGTAFEAEIAARGQDAIEDLEHRGVPSAFACPDCHGVLWEMRDGDLVRYRCRVGHAYLPQALAAAQSEQLEQSLWVALRTLKEHSALSKRLAQRARDRKMQQLASTYETRAHEASQRAALIEDVLKRGRLNAAFEEAIAADKTLVSKKAEGGEP